MQTAAATVSLSPAGNFHTAISLVAVLAGLFAVVRHKEISAALPSGKIYVFTTALSCITGFGIFRHGQFGAPHVLGLITLLVLGIALLAERSKIFGKKGPYVWTVSYSATLFFHFIPGVSSSDEVSKTSYSLVDSTGRIHAKLTVEEGAPTLAFFDSHQHARLKLGLNEEGLPQLLLHGLPAAVPTVKLECDAMGSHLMFSGAGREQGYFFLKSTGGSGLVLFGPEGQRQVEVLLTPEGAPRWTLWDRSGKVTAASEPSAWSNPEK